MIRDNKSENLDGILILPGQRSSFKERRKRKRELSPKRSPTGVRFARERSNRKARRTSINLRVVSHHEPKKLHASGSSQSTPSRTKALHSIRAKTPLRLRRKSVQRLTANQLSTLYNTCTKLLAQNRISEKNSWDYNFIEHFNDMLRSKKTWGSSANSRQVSDESLDFVTAGHLLATSTRFYSCRVDSLAKSTYKVLGGLQAPGVGDKQNKKKEKTKKKVNKNTLEMNKNITMNPNEQLSNIDPLFHKTTTLFDAGGTKDLLLNYLHIDSSGVSILLDGEQKFISSAVQASNEDPPMPSLKEKEDTLQSEILPAIGLFDFKLLEEEEDDIVSETNAIPQDAFAPEHIDDMLDFASVVNVDEVPDFGDDQMVDIDNDDIPQNIDSYAIPGGGVASVGDIVSPVSNIPVNGSPNLGDSGLSNSNFAYDIPNLPEPNMEDANQNSELSTSLLSSIAAHGNWAGNVLSIRKQLSRMRRKKADALRAINQLRVEKKDNATREKKDKFKLDFSLENIRSLPPSEEAFVQLTEKELKSSIYPQVDPASRFTSTGNPITSEWNLLPNDLYLDVDIWKTLMVCPDFNVTTPIDAQIVRQRGYNYIPAKKVQNDERDFNGPNYPSFEPEDIPLEENTDIPPIDSPHFDDGFDDIPPPDTQEPTMLLTEEKDVGTSELNIVKFDHKYAAGHDLVDHAKVKKFTLKPQPRPQDILYLKQSMGRAIASKKSDSFKHLVGDVLVRLSENSRTRLNFGSCLLVLLTLANRQSLSLEREENNMFGDFVVKTEPETNSKSPPS